jgi:hypothetical protein
VTDSKYSAGILHLFLKPRRKYPNSTQVQGKSYATRAIAFEALRNPGAAKTGGSFLLRLLYGFSMLMLFPPFKDIRQLFPPGFAGAVSSMIIWERK